MQNHFETHADRDGYLYRLIMCKHKPPHSTKRKFTGENTNQGLDKALKIPDSWIGTDYKILDRRLFQLDATIH